MVVGIIILVVITLMNSGNQSADTSLDLSFGLIIKYFLAGACASSAMLLPGISIVYATSIWCLWNNYVSHC